MDHKRLTQGDVVAGIAGIALLVFLFLPWYSLGIDTPEIQLPDVPGLDLPQPSGIDDDVSGWDALTDWDGFLIALAGVTAMLMAVLAACGRRVNLGGLPRGGVTTGLGGLAAAVILWRIFVHPAGGLDDTELGIFLGLAAAAGIAVGGLLVLREGGHEPLLPLTGGPRGAKRRASGARAKTKPAAKR